MQQERDYSDVQPAAKRQKKAPSVAQAAQTCSMAASSPSSQDLALHLSYDVSESVFNEKQNRMFMASIKAPKYESVR